MGLETLPAEVFNHLLGFIEEPVQMLGRLARCSHSCRALVASGWHLLHRRRFRLLPFQGDGMVQYRTMLSLIQNVHPTPLMFQQALEQGQTGLVRLYIAAGIDIPPLEIWLHNHLCLEGQPADILRDLLPLLTVPEGLNSRGETLLHSAARLLSESEFIPLLLSRLSPLVLDGKGGTPAHRAAKGGNETALEHLLAAEPHALNVEDQRGQRQLHRLCESHLLANLESHQTASIVANVMLQHPVDLDARDQMGQTALFLAVKNSLAWRRGHLYTALANGEEQEEPEVPLEFITFLLDHRADPNISNTQSRTPLHLAARDGAAELTRLLLERGADPDLEDSAGQKPYALAIARRHFDCAALFHNEPPDPRKSLRTN